MATTTNEATIQVELTVRQANLLVWAGLTFISEARQQESVADPQEQAYREKRLACAEEATWLISDLLSEWEAGHRWTL